MDKQEKGLLDVAIVGCIEAGPLEQENCLLVKTLRAFGGALKDAPVFLVRARPGPPLLPSTVHSLETLGVRVVNFVRGNRFSFWPHYNKPRAVCWAAEHLSARWLLFLDSDILVCDDLGPIIPKEEAQFAAAAEAHIVASSGPGDPNEGFWQHGARVCGVDLDKWGWIKSYPEKDRVRCYWNSGVVALDAASDLPRRWLENCERLYKENVVSPTHGRFFLDQVALALSVASLGLRHRTLDHRYNHQVNVRNRTYSCPEENAGSVILHYHKSMHGEWFPQFREEVRASFPKLIPYVDSCGKLENRTHPWPRQKLEGLRRRIRERRKNRMIRSSTTG